MIDAPRVRRASAVLALAALLGACAKTPPPTQREEPVARWPANLSEFVFVWSAEPGIDLLEGSAVAVRAYQESTVVASLGGSDDYLYPGFERAVGPDPGPDFRPPAGTDALWPETGFPVTGQRIGTSRRHILRVVENGRDVTVTVCDWLWGSAESKANGGAFVSGPDNPAAPGIQVTRYSLVKPASWDSELAAQKGPSRFPLGDVFGDWRVIGVKSAIGPVGAGPTWSDFNQDLAACNAIAPEPADRRQFLTTGEHPRSDFPTLPPYPGWPAENN